MADAAVIAVAVAAEIAADAAKVLHFKIQKAGRDSRLAFLFSKVAKPAVS